MSNSVARTLTPTPLHNARYGVSMIVRTLGRGDVDAVVTRVAERLTSEARRHPLVSPRFDARAFARALSGARAQTWVAQRTGVVAGHLYGAVLDSPEHGRAAWVGPDGVSFDDASVLAALYQRAAASWSERGAHSHFAWVFDDPTDTAPWYELGFTRAHVRGVLALHDARAASWPEGYRVRRGEATDIDVALELEQILDDAQLAHARARAASSDPARREEWRTTLADPDVSHYVVEYAGCGVAQAITFELDSRRGSFDRTIHVSAAVVRPAHQHRGVARALVGHVIHEARANGLDYAEVNWRVANSRANAFWRAYGFRVTYVRLERNAVEP